MHDTVRKLNETLSGTVAMDVLSGYGKRAYFPKGIVAQSVEAKQDAYTANATAGVALSEGRPLSLSFFSEAVPALSLDDMVSYAPTAGVMELRQAWWMESIRKNPSLEQMLCSLPVVTAGLTHAISLAADLFLDDGDVVVIPDPCWDNYEQIFAVRHKSRMVKPPLFDANGQLDVGALGMSIMGESSSKIFVLLNFPNNPTGYAPTIDEASAIVQTLVACADSGKRLVVVVDDAYFGLFHEPSVCTESLFALLCNVHDGILAVKCDAATKESLAWGLRIGFVTYGSAGLTGSHYHAMVQKTMGAIRSSVSSCSRIGQSLLLAAMCDRRFRGDTERVAAEMKRRYRIVRDCVDGKGACNGLRPLPFNSGYFFSFVCEGDAEKLRRYLLRDVGIGTVSIDGRLLRIAYSSVDAGKLPDVVDSVYRSAQEAWR